MRVVFTPEEAISFIQDDPDNHWVFLLRFNRNTGLPQYTTVLAANGNRELLYQVLMTANVPYPVYRLKRGAGLEGFTLSTSDAELVLDQMGDSLDNYRLDCTGRPVRITKDDYYD